MFTLCIPTMDRFDRFLDKNLQFYLKNNLISEIIITDENGKDYDKIEKKFNHKKLRLFKNEYKLGPFLNKLKCCKLASNEWIVLMDSDNFADLSYFEIAKEYICSNNISKTSILSPSFAKPCFDYRYLSGIINKSNLNTYNQKQDRNMLPILMNTGNYIINKHLIHDIDISNEHEIDKSSACDVIYFNTLLFEQFDLQFHCVSGMEYEHVVHPGSIYTISHLQFVEFNKKIHKRFNKICK